MAGTTFPLDIKPRVGPTAPDSASLISTCCRDLLPCNTTTSTRCDLTLHTHRMSTSVMTLRGWSPQEDMKVEISGTLLVVSLGRLWCVKSKTSFVYLTVKPYSPSYISTMNVHIHTIVEHTQLTLLPGQDVALKGSLTVSGMVNQALGCLLQTISSRHESFTREDLHTHVHT